MNISRRQFGLSVGGAAAITAIGKAQDQSSSGRKLRYCIVGLGRISLQHFMPGCKMSQQSQVVAVVSGHRDKAEKTAAEYGVSAKNIYDYKNYDEIAQNSDIDAVYIALPNSMHAEYTIRSSISACKAASKKLMIAYRLHYEPTNLKAIQLIREGKLGTIQAIESANGFVEHAGEWRLNKKLAGGGPLMDVGIYSLNACRYLTGEEPVHVEGYSSVIDKDGRFSEVEENVGWTMRFPSGVVASCNSTYGAQMNGYYRVHGSQGILHVEPAFAYEGLHLKAEFKGANPIDEPNTEKDPMQFAREADYFAGCIFDNKEPRSSGEEGLRDMQLMTDIYKTAGIKLS